MLDLNFEKSDRPWQIEARSGEVTFEFSGTFEKNRTLRQKRHDVMEKLIRVELAVIGLAGLIILFWTGKGAIPAHNYYFLFHRSFANLVIWISALTDCYLWAQIEAKRIEELSLNLIGFENYGIKFDEKQEIDVYELFSPGAKNSWNGALDEALARGAQAPTTSDVFISLLVHPDVQFVFNRLGLNLQTFTAEARDMFTAAGYQEDPEALRKLPFQALNEALKLRNRSIDSLMILSALVSNLPKGHPVQKLLFKYDLDLEKLEILSTWDFNLSLLVESHKTFRKFAALKSGNQINKGLTSRPTQYLNQFSEDVTYHAKYSQVPISIGRGPDLDEIFKMMSEGRRNFLVKGQPGTGRTAVINELAYKMVTEQVPKILQDKRLVKLEVGAIVGSSLPAEQVLTNCLNEAQSSGNIVLAMEDIHLFAKAKSTQGLSLLDILVSHVENSNIPVICTSTSGDYLDFLHHSPNFDQVFNVYELKPLTRGAAILASCIKASLLENPNQCYFTYAAVEQAVDLTDLYFKDVGQPQKSINILTEAAVRAKHSAGKLHVITPTEIQNIVAEKTHVPQQNLNSSEADKLMNLETELGKYIIGQKAAVVAVAEALRRSRSGLDTGKRPIGSFLFVGPTGVGKTELAKTLSRVYFGAESYFLRLDMSEYQGQDGLQKMIGSGSSQDNMDSPFIKHLKEYPFCLFLLDEFEKSSREVTNLFLQILEDGRLTTAKGEVMDLTHTIIIATSNAGTVDIQQGIKNGETLEHIRTRLFNEILMKNFPPELLNRFDQIILFTALSPEEIDQVTRLQMSSLIKQLEEKNIKLTVSDAAIKEVSIKGFDPALGARPIRRYIQDHVEGIIAKMILSHQVGKGSEISLDFANGEFTTTAKE